MSQVESGPICRECGATNDPGAPECWLCRRRDWQRPPAVRPEPPSPAPPRGRLSPIATWMVLIAVIGVTLGLLHEVPGLAIVLLLLVGPPLALTEIKARRRQRRGQPMSGGERALWVLGLTFLIPVVLVATLVAVAFVCVQITG